LPLAVSLQQLQTDALIRADMVNSPLYPTGAGVTDLNRLINQGITEFYDLLIASGEDYYLSSTTIATVSTTDTYALTNDFLAVKGVDINLGGQQYFSGLRFNWADRNLYKLAGTGWFYGQPVYYDLRGQNIVFMPAPQGIYTITVWYYPVPPVLSALSDTLDGVNGWDELVTLSAAIKMLKREESFDAADRLVADYAACKARIQSRASKRNAGEPPRVTDIRRGNRAGWRRRVS
jgi:hypothetical protein